MKARVVNELGLGYEGKEVELALVRYEPAGEVRVPVVDVMWVMWVMWTVWMMWVVWMVWAMQSMRSMINDLPLFVLGSQLLRRVHCGRRRRTDTTG